MQYYCTQLKNGPLYRWVKKYTYNFKIPFWRNPPDILGSQRFIIATDVIAGYASLGATNYGNCITLGSELSSFRTNVHASTRTKMPLHMEKAIRNGMLASSSVAGGALTTGMVTDQYHQFKAGYRPSYNYPHGGFGAADLYTLTTLYTAAYKPTMHGDPAAAQTKEYFEEDWGLHTFNHHVNPYWPSSRARVATPAFESIIRWTIPFYVPEDKEIRLDKYVTTDLSGKVFMSGQSRQYTVQIPLSARPGQVVKEFKLHTIPGQFGSGDTVFESPLVEE